MAEFNSAPTQEKAADWAELANWAAYLLAFILIQRRAGPKMSRRAAREARLQWAPLATRHTPLAAYQLDHVHRPPSHAQTRLGLAQVR